MSLPVGCLCRAQDHQLSRADATPAALEKFIPLFFSKLHIECLVHGNMDPAVRCHSPYPDLSGSLQAALQLVNGVADVFARNRGSRALSEADIYRRRQVQLEPGSTVAIAE